MTYPQLFVDKVIKSVTRKNAKTKNEFLTYLSNKWAEIGDNEEALKQKFLFSHYESFL